MPIRDQNPLKIGPDRLVNAVAGFDKLGGPCVVVDFGTAATDDIVSAEGADPAAILPGVEISLEALSDRAAALPKIDLVELRSLIGKSTGRCDPLGDDLRLRGDGRRHRRPAPPAARCLDEGDRDRRPGADGGPVCDSLDEVDDLLTLDLPPYHRCTANFAPPAQFKAWIDNIVRVGRTFGFDRSRVGEPYWPLLSQAGKTLVILSSRGDYGYGRGRRIEAMNHVEASISTAFNYIGVTDIRTIAIEYRRIRRRAASGVDRTAPKPTSTSWSKRCSESA